jgi:hypothetical protein
MTPLESSEGTLQAVALPTIIILTPLEGIYSTGVTHDNRHSRSSHFIVQAIGLTHKWHASLKKDLPKTSLFCRSISDDEEKSF